MVQLQLDLLEHLIEAYYQKEKLTKLRAANEGSAAACVRNVQTVGPAPA